VKPFNLEEICKNRKRKGNYLVARLHESLEMIEKDIKEIQGKIFKNWLSWEDISEYLMLEKPDFYNQFISPILPDWVLNVEGEYQTLVNDKRKKNLSVFDQWVQGEDLRIISTRKEESSNPIKKGNRRKQNQHQNTFGLLEEQNDYETLEWINTYKIPNGNRSLNELLNTYSVWHLSKAERCILHDHWKTKILDELTE
ncbi:7405_t:CDS:1, partial [Funneliformis geosporum]